MKSRIIARRPYSPETIIIVDDGRLPKELLDMHKQRIDTIFAKQTEQYRNEQLNKVIMHDILFSKAMDFLSRQYEFDIHPEDVEEYQKFILGNNPIPTDQNVLASLKIAATQQIIKDLIFNDIKERNNITVTDEELEKVLLSYYQQTNQPIRNFKNDKNSYENARMSILSEKIVNHILSSFKFDLDKFNKQVEEMMKKVEAAKEASKEINKETIKQSNQEEKK